MKIDPVLNIYEARRNPDKNPKISVYERLKERYEKDGDNLYVSFTTVDKLGINPRSGYQTPLGIYAYPANYVLSEVYHYKGDMSRLPFAGSSDYANIFNASGNIIQVDKMTKDEMMKYFEKMRDYYLKRMSGSWKTKVDHMEKLLNDSSSLSTHSSPGGRFWYISMNVADELTYGDGGTGWNSNSLIANKKIVNWNHMMRDIGIDGCVDSGAGIIHTAEPVQAVFFSKSVIKNVERLHNKWSQRSMEEGKELGKYEQQKKENFREMWKRSNFEQRMAVMDSYSLNTIFKYVKLTEEEILGFINQTDDEDIIDLKPVYESKKHNMTDRIKEALIKKSINGFVYFYIYRIPLSKKHVKMGIDLYGADAIKTHLRFYFGNKFEFPPI